VSDVGNMYDSRLDYRYPGTITSSLLGAVKEAQEDAWERVTTLYAPLVYFWCRRTGLQASDAEDIVQEVLCTVAARVAEFERNRTEGSFRRWLRTITRNKIGDFIRNDRRRRQFVLDMSAFEEPSASSHADAGTTEKHAKEETRLLINQVMLFLQARFGEPTWLAFLRQVKDDVPARMVAEELGLSIESVYQAKSRVLRKLRDELRELGE
jgi:RNA polymerase sigma-70 factor (ECF subfamily)